MNGTCLAVLLTVAAMAQDDAARVVAKVNGTAITAGDVEFMVRTRQVKADERAGRDPQLIEELIDRQLIREFLAKRKFAAPADELAFQIQQAEEAIRTHGDDPATLLPKVGYSAARLKSELGLPLAWQAYIRHTVTLPQTKEYFDRHRAELDGTRLRARQIVLKLRSPASDAELQEKTDRLKLLRDQIVSKRVSFQEAARMHSESPAREQGGDVGTFGFRGRLPTPVVRAAFALKVNEISEPVVSAFGVHLIQVTERIPGELSLEDVRPQIIDELSRQMWNDTASRERKSARIERTNND